MGNKSSSLLSDTSDRFAKNTTEHSSEQLSYGVSHMRGWRDYMEDATIHIDHFPGQGYHLFAVFDGHAGPEVALYVERHFPMQLALNHQIQAQNYGQALIDTFHAMDEQLKTSTGKQQLLSIIRHNVALGNRQPYDDEDQMAGCTANVCLITPQHIFVANAGDSRSVAYCKGHHTVPLSYDHKPTDKNQYRRIRKAGGFVHNGRINHALNMSRSLGDLQFKSNLKLGPQQQMIIATPDVIGCKRQDVQFILMGCDGIWQRRKNEEMMGWVRQRVKRGKTPGAILQELFDSQLAQDDEGVFGTDNMSAILIIFHH